MRPSIALAALGTCLLVLGLMLLPVTGCGCSKVSKASASLWNVKQQSLGLIQYQADHDDRFPPRDLWMDAILPYVKEERVFHDPGYLKTDPEKHGYAFNAALSRARTPKDPDRVPLVYESANPIRNASDKYTSLPRPGRHGGKSAVAYADGHARRVQP